MTAARQIFFAIVGLLLLTVCGFATVRGVAFAAEQDQPKVARGKYLVEGVAECWRCHTPRDEHGDPDRTRWLLGAPVIVRPTIDVLSWAERAPRLSGSPPGTDEDFVKLMMTGISRTGRPPRQPMPRFRMTREDAEAVLAYLKSLAS